MLDLTRKIKCLCLFATHYFELTELSKESGIDNYHVTAKELNGNLILLHKVQSGPASQSHGLQVAKLAGIPASVIKEAQKRLKILEKQQVPSVTVTQNDLFASIDESTNTAAQSEISVITENRVVEKIIEVEKSSPALDALAQLDIDNLTPREALAQLYQLKELIN